MKTLKQDVVRAFRNTKYLTLYELDENDKKNYSTVNYVVECNGNQTGFDTLEKAEKYYKQTKYDIL